MFGSAANAQGRTVAKMGATCVSHLAPEFTAGLAGPHGALEVPPPGAPLCNKTEKGKKQPKYNCTYKIQAFDHIGKRQRRQLQEDI